jgi:amidase
MTLFEKYDFLAMPTTQVWPFPVETAYPMEIAGQGIDTYHRWMQVVTPASLLGLPSLAVPTGFSSGGLPAGIQIIGAPGTDKKLLEVGEAYHLATMWPQKAPPPEQWTKRN